MFKFKARPYNLLLLTAAIILIASFFAIDQSLDVHLHDTYFIIAKTHSFWIIIILLLIFWALHSLTRRFLFSKILTWLNVTLLVSTSVFLVVISFFSNNYYNGLGGMPRRYYDYGSWDTIMLSNNLTKAIFVAMVFFTFGLIVYTTNLFLGLFKKFRGHNSR